MKHYLLSPLLFLSLVFVSVNTFSQEYKKDHRNQNEKEDSHNRYQYDRLSQVDLLKALELAGVRIFKFPLSFDKTYRILLVIDEYTNGEKKNLSSYELENTYNYWEDKEDTIYFTDYIDNITFFTRDRDSLMHVIAENYAMSLTGIKLPKKTDRGRQFYQWRTYSKTDWKLNEEIPLLIYASSWMDSNGVERFCGVVDLSHSEEDTQELLDSSPHYFMISYKVCE